MKEIETTMRLPWYAATAAFLGIVAAAVFLQQLYLMALPCLLLLGLLLLQQPLLLFYTLVAAVPWSVEYNFTGSFGTDLPDEPLMLLCALAAILWLLYNNKQIKKKPFLHPLLLVLLLQMLWWMLLVATSTHPLLSLKFLLAKSWYLLAFVILPLCLFDNKKEIKTSALVLSISMGLFVLLALLRHAYNGFTFASINNSLAPFFRNHVNYSALLVCTLPLLLAYIRFSKNKVPLIFIVVIQVAALYLSYARGAWLAFIAGGLAYLFFIKGKLVHLYVFSILTCFSAVVWIKEDNRYLKYAPDFNTTIFHTDFREHIIATYQLKDVSTAERFYRWVAGVRMTTERPLAGFGTNTFNYHYKSYTVTAFKTWVSRNEERSTVHNFFLLTFIEQGAIGLLLTLSLIGYMFYTAYRVYQQTADVFWKTAVACIAAVLAMICVLNFLSDLIETDKIGSVFYLCLGFLVCADVQTKKQNHLQQHK